MYRRADGGTDVSRPALLLDFDGVLIDSWPVAVLAFRAAFDETVRARGEPPTEAFRGMMGRPLPDIVAQFGYPEAFVPAFQRVAHAHAAEVRVFDGVRDMLAELTGQGLALGLVTGKDRTRTLFLLEHFGLLEHFVAVVAGDEAPGKPSPAPLQLCEARMRCSRSLAYVGDSTADAASARALGRPFILATWGGGQVPEPDHVATAPGQLSGICRSLDMRLDKAV